MVGAIATLVTSVAAAAGFAINERMAAAVVSLAFGILAIVQGGFTRRKVVPLVRAVEMGVEAYVEPKPKA
jgi:hypothetical protein